MITKSHIWLSLTAPILLTHSTHSLAITSTLRFGPFLGWYSDSLQPAGLIALIAAPELSNDTAKLFEQHLASSETAYQAQLVQDQAQLLTNSQCTAENLAAIYMDNYQQRAVHLPRLIAQTMLERQQQERENFGFSRNSKSKNNAAKKAAKAMNARSIHRELLTLNHGLQPHIISIYEQTLQSVDFEHLAQHLRTQYQAQQAALAAATKPTTAAPLDTRQPEAKPESTAKPAEAQPNSAALRFQR